ncbi:MAG TPA: 6,7-dimethyl-8-ribityllumazine synthase [Opitutaceae bacterium]|mgnify:CR=1 FL=1|nr:6,7-dimethyl-8-ribityllumazine synthase [Opitutaceae bacterium]HRJ47695.1 6,7-dimethyl-8-ribityllumazine synthase [Opitutaceae bacterium]
MSLDAPNSPVVDGARFSFGVAAARFNAALVDGLLASFRATLERHGVASARIEVVRVPGSHELPYAIQRLADTGEHDCLVALGVLIGGDTNHHEMVGASVSAAFQDITIQSRLPVINGVIVADTRPQAEARCTGPINRGAEFAQAALEMAALKRSFSA